MWNQVDVALIFTFKNQNKIVNFVFQPTNQWFVENICCIFGEFVRVSVVYGMNSIIAKFNVNANKNRCLQNRCHCYYYYD